MKKVILSFMCVMMVFSGCSNMSKTGKGTLIGSGAGAAIGAGLGAIIGKDGKGAAIGAAIGTAVGAGAGAVIGKKMDKKAEELKALENAQVETVEDQNGLEAIKVTFNSGILFDTNKADLKQASKNELSQFATKMSDMVDTDITIYGHTDSSGNDAINQPLSEKRAQSVADYLKNCGISSSRMTVEGKSSSMPVADNATKEGKAQNRRVEIYITANQKMIEAAENGTLD
ncbi:MAG: OmpA family protein [Bacteroidales bacterium]|jgi:Outer membrane protein and related peptidoglycan-associated (lipo)proteins|nr:OmpA family protein [Bacteroidales bacterium]